MWECVLPGECVSSERAYGHRDGHQPAWLRLLLPLCHLLDYSRCHIGMDGGEDNTHAHTNTHKCRMQSKTMTLLDQSKEI